MNLSRTGHVLSCHDRIIDELYSAETLVNVTLTSCKNREFCGEYYGMPKDYVTKLSNERNEYISMLTIISDKLKHIQKLNINLEEELSVTY